MKPDTQHILLNSASVNIHVNAPTLLMTVYYSSYHLWAAKHFSELAGRIEEDHSGNAVFDIEHRAYVTGSILSSAAFLEGAINEILAEDLWLPTLDKYQEALGRKGKKPFDKGGQLYQDAQLAIRLRNELMHFKIKTLGGSIKHPLEASLTGKFTLNRLMVGSGNPFFPDHCLGHGCTEWALNACRKFADEFFAEIGEVPNYQRVNFDKPQRIDGA